MWNWAEVEKVRRPDGGGKREGKQKIVLWTGSFNHWHWEDVWSEESKYNDSKSVKWSHVALKG